MLERLNNLVHDDPLAEKNDGYDMIGEVRFNGDDEEWNMNGCFTDRHESGGGFDWGYKHPRIGKGGSFWTFKVHRPAEYTKGDAEFKVVCSYFTGWNDNKGDCKVDIRLNNEQLCKDKVVKPERDGRQIDEFFLSKTKFNYPESAIFMTMCKGSKSTLYFNRLQLYVKQV